MVLVERRGGREGEGGERTEGRERIRAREKKKNRGLYLTLPLGKLKGVCLIKLSL